MGIPSTVPSSCCSDMTGSGGTGQSSCQYGTLVTAGGPPPMSQATNRPNAASAAAMNNTLTLRVKRAPRPK